MATSHKDSQSSPHLKSALAEFLQAYPAFQATSYIDDFREREFSCLDEQRHIYLDYTGGGLYADFQILEHTDILRNRVFGNPHSTEPTSEAATELIERARSYILDYFNASPDEYVAIFTSNATGAIKLVGEGYPFRPGDHYVLTFDNHKSVNRIREVALEECTLNYLGLPAVAIGLKHIESVGIDSIHQRVENLTGGLIDNLVWMRHDNGTPLVSIFGLTDLDICGGTVTVNCYDVNGKLIDHRQIEHFANEANISLSTGCFCNPGEAEAAHGLTREDMDKTFAGDERMTFEQLNDIIERTDGKSVGAVRISLNIASNFEDVHRFLAFARQLLNKVAGELPARWTG